MERTPKQVVLSILANLEMVIQVIGAEGDKAKAEGHLTRELVAHLRHTDHRALANLIRTEAAQILAEPSITGKSASQIIVDEPIVRHLSDGTPVEMVRPFGDDL